MARQLDYFPLNLNAIYLFLATISNWFFHKFRHQDIGFYVMISVLKIKKVSGRKLSKNGKYWNENFKAWERLSYLAIENIKVWPNEWHSMNINIWSICYRIEFVPTINQWKRLNFKWIIKKNKQMFFFFAHQFFEGISCFSNIYHRFIYRNIAIEWISIKVKLDEQSLTKLLFV